jgi:hypothetical protein
MTSAGPGEFVQSGTILKPHTTSPRLASGFVKSAMVASDGTSGAFCQEKCFCTVHTPPMVPPLRSWAPTPVWRSIAAAVRTRGTLQGGGRDVGTRLNSSS